MTHIAIDPDNTRTDWGTPQKLFDLLNNMFGFTLDGAASEKNKKCARFYSEEDNAFTKNPFHETIFVSPPYGKGLHDWIELFADWSIDNIVVALLPNSTETDWFEIAWEFATDIYFLHGRVNFEGSTSGNTRGNIVVVFSNIYSRYPRCHLLRWAD